MPRQHRPISGNNAHMSGSRPLCCRVLAIAYAGTDGRHANGHKETSKQKENADSAHQVPTKWATADSLTHVTPSERATPC